MAYRFPQLGADPRNGLIACAGDAVQHPDDRARKPAADRPFLLSWLVIDVSPGLCPLSSGFYLRPAGVAAFGIPI